MQDVQRRVRQDFDERTCKLWRVPHRHDPTARFATSVTARWLVLPSLAELHAGQLKDVAAKARALPAALGPGPTGTAGYSVKSSAPDLLTQVDRALLVSRSTLLIPALQLVVLALYTLMLVSRLLAEHRRVEITLMRARGASGRQIAALAVGEGLLLSVPSAVAAPFLAPLLVRAAMATRLLGTSGPHLDLGPSALTWGIAIAVFGFGPSTVFPGYAALLPAVGTAIRKFGLTFTVRDSDDKHVGKVEIERPSDVTI